MIEDYAPLRTAICAILTDAGYVAVPAQDGVAGMDAVRELGADLVITDISMPNQDGLETICEIRKVHGSLPIIAVSGRFGAVGSLADATVFGADVAIGKPFEGVDLLAAVRRLLEGDDQNPRHAAS